MCVSCEHNFEPLCSIKFWGISQVTEELLAPPEPCSMELMQRTHNEEDICLLQASVFLNGNGAGESSHISAYIKILPGEYDALLRWPFSHSVSFTLFDQSNIPEKVSLIFYDTLPYQWHLGNTG